MIPHALRHIYTRDLKAVILQVEAYPSEEELWHVVPGIANSGGTLALHVAGNLQHYVGSVLGDTGYERDRDAEFARRDVPRQQIIGEVRQAIVSTESTLRSLSEVDMQREYPLVVAERRLRTGDLLIHLAAHLGYHLGQIDYHRRILTGEERVVDGVRTRDLPEFGLEVDPALHGHR